MNDIKSFDFGPIQKCPFWPMPLHFRNASAASGYILSPWVVGLTTFTLSLKKERKPFKDRELPSLLSCGVAYQNRCYCGCYLVGWLHWLTDGCIPVIFTAHNFIYSKKDSCTDYCPHVHRILEI